MKPERRVKEQYTRRISLNDRLAKEQKAKK